MGKSAMGSFVLLLSLPSDVVAAIAGFIRDTGDEDSDDDEDDDNDDEKMGGDKKAAAAVEDAMPAPSSMTFLRCPSSSSSAFRVDGSRKSTPSCRGLLFGL